MDDASADSGPAFAGYTICPYTQYACKHGIAILKCMSCGKHPLHGNDIEDVRESGLKIFGNGGQRLNPNKSCWNLVGYYNVAEYVDGQVHITVLNEDPGSHYYIRGYHYGSSQPDILAEYPGTGTDGKHLVRTHSWSVSASHDIDAGNTDYDELWIAECPIMVIQATCLEILEQKLPTADDWNNLQYVSERVMILLGDDFGDEVGESMNRRLEYIQAAYETQGTPTVILRESDYEAGEHRAVGIQEINNGVGVIHALDYDSGPDAWTKFISGHNYPFEDLTMGQRLFGYFPGCEIHCMTIGDPIFEKWGANDPSNAVLIGSIGNMNGDYEHRHMDANDVIVRELDNLEPGTTMAQFNWRVNYILATQFGGYNIDYARGNTLFANELIYPPYHDFSIMHVETKPPVESVRLWSKPTAVGTDIRFALPNMTEVSLDVYGLDGRKVSTIANTTFGPGTHRWTWYQRDSNGARVASGMYFVKLVVDGEAFTNKVLVIR